MHKSLEINVVRKDAVVGGRSFQILGENKFQIKNGEFVTILGASGCGKTTLLRMILGLDNDYEGEISLGGKRICKPGVERAVVFQEPRLLPWMSVIKNIEFGITSQKNKKKFAEQARHLVSLVGLAGFENAWPNQLSGGMAQRAALARALVNIPDVLLLDEPFGALDSQTRMMMQDELQRVLREEQTTTLLVTHDVDEAVLLSDKVIMMGSRPGTCQSTFSIDLEKPRNRLDSQYLNIRSQILEKLINPS
jgi:ABC-type nitrate/sulfonate/bicarbonate transport system ATPase subunit